MLGFASCTEPAETAVPRLVEQLKSRDAHQRNLAARALADYEEEAEPAVKQLIKTLWDDNIGVRSSAAYALTKIGSKDALKAIEDYKKAKERLKQG